MKNGNLINIFLYISFGQPRILKQHYANVHEKKKKHLSKVHEEKSSKVMIVRVANRANLQQNCQHTALYFRELLFYNINNLLYTLSQAISLYFDGLAVTSEYVGGKSSLGSYSFLVS